MALTSPALPSLLLHQWMSSGIIMHSFIVLLLCQCMNSLVYREKISLPPLPLCLSLSLTISLPLFLLFHIFKCQLYLCWRWSFDVFSTGFCEWELISKCSLRCFFLRSSKSKIKEITVPLPLVPYRFLSLHFSLQLFYLWIEMQSMRWLTCCLSCQYGRLYQGSGVSWPEGSVDSSACSSQQGGL